jgi:hypothetical protein
MGLLLFVAGAFSKSVDGTRLPENVVISPGEPSPYGPSSRPDGRVDRDDEA